MSSLSPLSNPGPFHILTYGTLLGSTIFNSFIGGIIAFRALPRPQFSTLQSSLFPIYFSLQTLLPVLLALTYPGHSSSPSSALSSGGSTSPSSLSGVFAPENRWTTLLPLSLMALCGLANWAVVGPQTTRVMKERKHQETRDGKRSYDKGPHSPAMEGLNRRFGLLHGVSSLLNLVALGGMVGYGWVLGGRMV